MDLPMWGRPITNNGTGSGSNGLGLVDLGVKTAAAKPRRAIRILQSTTIIYKDRNGRAAAALCLNADVSAWVSLRSAMDRFVLGDYASSMQPSPIHQNPS
jgi:hypothetical protein